MHWCSQVVISERPWTCWVFLLVLFDPIYKRHRTEDHQSRTRRAAGPLTAIKMSGRGAAYCSEGEGYLALRSGSWSWCSHGEGSSSVHGVDPEHGQSRERRTPSKNSLLQFFRLSCFWIYALSYFFSGKERKLHMEIWILFRCTPSLSSPSCVMMFCSRNSFCNVKKYFVFMLTNL